MYAPFENRPEERGHTRAGLAKRVAPLLLGWALLPIAVFSADAQITATWTGTAGTSSYADPANWDIVVVPVNDLTNQYNVTIPSSKSVEFDLDGSHEITDLTLGTGSTLSIAPGEQLTVLDDARISGIITTIGGTFIAPGTGAQFLDNQARLAASGTGSITVAANVYSGTRSDYRGNLTLMSADGAGSSLDLSSVANFISQSYGYYGLRYYDVVASNGGVIDLSSVGSITGATDDDWLRFKIQSGGNITLSSLTQTSGRTRFVIDVDGYSLPALETASSTYFSVGTGFTASTPELLSISGGGSGVYINTGATLNALKLVSVNNTGLTIENSGTLNAPSLVALTNSTLTLGPTQTFNHGVITDVTGSELHVVDGAALTLSGVAGYTNTLTDYRNNLTLLSADGTGSLLDLSSAASFIAQSYGNYGTYYYDVAASNGGVIDLSSVGSISGATSDDWLRLKMQSGGDIPLTLLTQISGRTQFVIDVDGYSLPALETASNTYFSVLSGRTLSAAELVSMSGAGSGIALDTSAGFNAPKLTSLGSSGSSTSIGAGAVLDAGELVSINNVALSISAGGTVNAPKLTALTNTSFTARPAQTFNHGVITNVTGSELHVVDGAAWILDGVAGYTNTLTDSRAHLTLLSADGTGSLLDLSSAVSFIAQSYGNYGTYYYDVVASNGGVIDLSSVASITGATSDDWLRFEMQSGGNIPLSSLTQTSGRTKFVIDVDGYSLPALETASSTYFSVGASFTAGTPELLSISGGGSGIYINSEATLDALKLVSVNNAALTIEASGTLNAPSLVALTNSTLTLGPAQTFNHGVITDVTGSELHVVDGAVLTLNGVTGYTNTLTDYRYNLTLLSADGTGSLLDLSSAASFIAQSYGSYGTYYYDVAASNGGVIDLSSVGSITGATQDDWLRFKMQSGGDIPLSSLTQTSGRTRFVIDVDGYSLPALETASNTYFSVGAGFTAGAPELLSISGGGSGIYINSEATLEAPKLVSVNNAALTIEDNGTLNAPSLVALTNSTLTLGPAQTFNHGLITDVDGSELHVVDGAVLTLSGVAGYTNTLTDYQANLTLLSADGAGSLLDLSSAASFISQSYGHHGTRYYDVVASNGGVIDLSSVGSIAGAASDDWLRFRVQTGGRIDLADLRSVSGRVKFDVNGDGILTFGDIAITATTEFTIGHQDTDVTVNGSMYLSENSRLTMASGSRLKVAGDFLFAYTDESRLATDAGILLLDGSGIQFLEAGGEDLGLEGSTSGNFGFGRIVIGQDGQPTTVMLLDLLDNGNRIGEAREALYLYGVGGLDGLELLGGSTLVLNGISTYAWLDDQWEHLNSWFEPGVTEVPFGGGTVVVPEPSSAVLLALVAAGLLCYYRFRRA